MRPIVARSWHFAGLVSAFLAGCLSEDGPRQSACSSCGVPVARASAQPLPGGHVPDSYRVRPAMAAIPTGWQVPSDVKPVQYSRFSGPAPGPRPTGGTWTDYALKPVPVLPRRAPEPVPMVQPGPPPPSTGHAPDYRWLIGYLQHDPGRDTWSVRYADSSAPDLYGGILTLVNTGPMGRFQSGQLVRVDGELIDPAPYEIKPSFRVLALQLVNR